MTSINTPRKLILVQLYQETLPRLLIGVAFSLLSKQTNARLNGILSCNFWYFYAHSTFLSGSGIQVQNFYTCMLYEVTFCNFITCRLQLITFSHAIRCKVQIHSGMQKGKHGLIGKQVGHYLSYNVIQLKGNMFQVLLHFLLLDPLILPVTHRKH